MEFEITIVVGIAFIVGLVELAKNFEVFQGRGAFVLSLVLGQLGGLLYFADGDIKQGVWIGIGMALTASGLYSGTKSIVGRE